MSELWAFILFPVVGALIGWCTNWLAVKMIFRPREPRSILGFQVQGLLPRRRKELAENVAATVERDLLSIDQIQAVVKDMLRGENIHAQLRGRIDTLIDEQLGKLGGFAMFITPEVVQKIKVRIEQEVFDFVEVLSEQAHHSIGERIDIQAMVREKIEGFDLERLESMVFRIAATELRHIELLGGVLGFFVGLAEAGLVLLF